MKKINYVILIGLSILYFSCNSNFKKDELFGQWKVSDVKFEIPNDQPELMKNAKTLSLATVYEFKNDMSFCMTIKKTSWENGRKQIGNFIINDKNMTLNTDTLLFEKNETWIQIENKIFNSEILTPKKMTIEKTSRNQLIISEKESKGIIYYTLDRIE